MHIDQLKDKHLGEEFLLLGTGISLDNVSREFLCSRYSIGVNYITWYKRDFHPTYWVALDPAPHQTIPFLKMSTVVFVPQKNLRRLPEYVPKGRVIVYQLDEDVGELGHRDGTGYSTSLLGAAHLAHYMGATTFLIAGFDCSRGRASPPRKEPGKTGAPYFYDPDIEPMLQSSWDSQFGKFSDYMTTLGKRVVNLSDPTLCSTLERGDYRDWM